MGDGADHRWLDLVSAEPLAFTGLYPQPRHKEWYRLTLRYQEREHSVHFDGNRFAAELQDLASTVRSIAYRDFWEPKLLPESR